MNNLELKKQKLEDQIKQLQSELFQVNTQIAEQKFNAKIGQEVTVALTGNTYIVDSFYEDSVYVRVIKKNSKGLGTVQEAKYWTDYQKGQAKSPTRKY